MRKLKHGDMRNKCPNICVLQVLIYTRAKMRVHAGLINYVVYARAKCGF